MDRPQIFSMEIPSDPEKLDEFQQIMDLVHDETIKTIDSLAEELGVSSQCANSVWYLRARSRWTEELEKELIRLHKEGTPPNIFEFGN